MRAYRGIPVLLLVLVAGAAAIVIPALARSPRSASTAWSFKHDRGVRVAEGVSVEAVRTPEGAVRMYVTARGIGAYQSSDGLRFTAVQAATPQGSDPAIVPLSDWRMRMYYVAVEGPPPEPGQPPPPPQQQRKSVRSAISTDGLSWADEEGVRLADAGYGVPDVVQLPDGGWRMYWVDRGSNNESVIASARSSDGLNFTRESGHRLPEGYVDPAVVMLGHNSWLMAVSTLGVGKLQRVYLARSTDGLRWKLDAKPLIAPRGRSALDPTLLPLAKRRFRIYYSTASRQTFDGPFRVESGILRKD